MTNNPCTACKHHKQGHICGLTDHTTSKSRAYKTDKDDCFQAQYDKYEFHMGCDEWQEWEDFDKLECAQTYAEQACKTMGLYTATYAFISNDLKGYFEDIEI